MLRVSRVIFYSSSPCRVMLRVCYVCATCHINAYISAPSSVHYSF